MVGTDAFGNLIDFRPMPDQAHDLREVPALIEHLTGGSWLADCAFDAGELRQDLAGKNVTPVISPKSNRRFPATYDKHTYKWRHLV